MELLHGLDGKIILLSSFLVLQSCIRSSVVDLFPFGDESDNKYCYESSGVVRNSRVKSALWNEYLLSHALQFPET